MTRFRRWITYLQRMVGMVAQGTEGTEGTEGTAYLKGTEETAYLKGTDGMEQFVPPFPVHLVPTHKQPNLYFTIDDAPVDVPSVKIIRINDDYVYISHIADINLEYQDEPVKQIRFSWTKTQDLPDYSVLASYIENCFPNLPGSPLPNKTNIIIRSNMFPNKMRYSKENLCTYMDMLYSNSSVLPTSTLVRG